MGSPRTCGFQDLQQTGPALVQRAIRKNESDSHGFSPRRKENSAQIDHWEKTSPAAQGQAEPGTCNAKDLVLHIKINHSDDAAYESRSVLKATEDGAADPSWPDVDPVAVAGRRCAFVSLPRNIHCITRRES